MKLAFFQKCLSFLGFIWLLSWEAPPVQAFSCYIVPGHEYLTKFALTRLQSSDDKLTRVFYGDYVGGVNYLSHPLAYGNVVNDFPQLDPAFATSLIGILLGQEWEHFTAQEQKKILTGMIEHSESHSQVMHFTRNYLDPHQQQALSAKESCILSQNFIKNAVIYGTEVMAGQQIVNQNLDRYQRKQLGLKFIGASLHTVQDSFAPAHVKRHPQTHLLTDVCSFRYPYFGRNQASVYSVGCVHTVFAHERDFGGGSILEDDQIWQRSQDHCQIQSNGMVEKSFNCLTDQAQLGTIVSQDFLASLVPFLDQALRKQTVAYEDLTMVLDDFLNIYHPYPAKGLTTQGIMACDGLADFTPHTRFEYQENY
ncbi:sll0843 [Synechocystis sp. PCC 6803]|uniref:Sll0843 protein n=1 Tax=Synechocystis sp. (strain ATCC 27184 / PCC 6803 / Kazusa) TaxID=1111708 RepID=P73756_SYNY3|nr:MULTISPECIES: hypothetical protein [unclassified Synechocystis]AGF51496.1 hypothetical protein MYO_112430 [Synechocystis sp. PCC 6803]ALJ69421.1 hypothetical protein AOY38_06375 [Synechocystis sp. PCC 6803]AVP91271.1 hypothetical protein C7I86_06385 [Synechocystis sp. IPPAS B-1465]MBD2618579.1 hypothetical protein [Synechocystis sp. FACHB-898]MBD2637828.1 hypothetical protein [Synechocystis sp. FACHB-908]